MVVVALNSFFSLSLYRAPICIRELWICRLWKNLKSWNNFCNWKSPDQRSDCFCIMTQKQGSYRRSYHISRMTNYMWMVLWSVSHFFPRFFPPFPGLFSLSLLPFFWCSRLLSCSLNRNLNIIFHFMGGFLHINISHNPPPPTSWFPSYPPIFLDSTPPLPPSQYSSLLHACPSVLKYPSYLIYPLSFPNPIFWAPCCYVLYFLNKGFPSITSKI